MEVLFDCLHDHLVSVSGEADSASTAVCLSCHGPFEALQERTADFVAPSGVTVNPHITFDRTMPNDPHASGEGVIDCLECHEPHPVPVTDPVAPADIEACEECHHTTTFRSCASCH